MSVPIKLRETMCQTGLSATVNLTVSISLLKPRAEVVMPEAQVTEPEL